VRVSRPDRLSIRRTLAGRRWGSFTGGHLRFGVKHYRLVVFPPGTGGRERLLLRAWLAWPFVGTGLGLLVVLLVHDRGGVLVALGLAASVGVVGHVLLRDALGRWRHLVCVLHAEYQNGAGTQADLDRCRRVVVMAGTLADAEQSVARGRLSPVDFEQVWWGVYADARALSAGRRPSRP
jgi:hypothetical protein